MPKDLDKIIKHLEKNKTKSEKEILADYKKTYFLKSVELLFIAVLYILGIMLNFNIYGSIFIICYFILGSLIHGLYYPFFVKPDSESILNSLMFIFYNSLWSYMFVILIVYNLFIFESPK